MIAVGCLSTFFIEEDLRRVNLGKREQEAKDTLRESQSVNIPNHRPPLIDAIKVDSTENDKVIALMSPTYKRDVIRDSPQQVRSTQQSENVEIRSN